MVVSFTSSNYARDNVAARYVRKGERPNRYVWVEVCKDSRYSTREGFVCADELPHDVRQAADAAYEKRVWPAYVIWPITEGGAS